MTSRGNSRVTRPAGTGCTRCARPVASAFGRGTRGTRIPIGWKRRDGAGFAVPRVSLCFGGQLGGLGGQTGASSRGRGVEIFNMSGLEAGRPGPFLRPQVSGVGYGAALGVSSWRPGGRESFSGGGAPPGRARGGARRRQVPVPIAGAGAASPTGAPQPGRQVSQRARAVRPSLGTVGAREVLAGTASRAAMMAGQIRVMVGGCA